MSLYEYLRTITVKFRMNFRMFIGFKLIFDEFIKHVSFVQAGNLNLSQNIQDNSKIEEFQIKFREHLEHMNLFS